MRKNKQASSIEIFNTLEDEYSWDKHIEYCDHIKEFSNFEKEKAKRAFEFLRGELGERFLKKVYVDRYPISTYFANKAAWTRRWVIWFSDSLRQFKGTARNYSTFLVKKLKQKDRCKEAISVLEIAIKYRKSGFEIHFEPSLLRLDSARKPDLKIINRDTQEEFYCEATELNPSNQEKRAYETQHYIQNALIPLYGHSMKFSVRIYKTISRRHLEEIKKELHIIIDRAKQERSFQEFVIDRTIEIGISPNEDIKMLKKWSRQKDIDFSALTGPPVYSESVERIKGRIRKKQKKLHKNHVNIIFIKLSDFTHIQDDVKNVIAELEETVYDYPHVLSLVIAGGNLCFRNKTTQMIDQHLFIAKKQFEVFEDRSISIFNKYCDVKVSPMTVARLNKALVNY